MQTLISKISSIGIQPGMDRTLEKHVRIGNRLGFFLMVSVLPLSGVYAYFGLDSLALLVAVCGIAYTFGPLLNHFHFYALGAHFAFVVTLPLLLGLCVLLGEGTGIHYYFICLSSTCIVLFDPKRRFTFALGASAPIICFALSQLLYQMIPPMVVLPAMVERIIWWSSTLNTMICSFMVGYFYYTATEKAEADLAAKMEELAHAKANEAALAMAAAYGHHINNPLLIATMTLEIEQEKLSVDNHRKLKTSLDRIAEAVKKIEETLTLRGIDLENYGGTSKMLKLK